MICPFLVACMMPGWVIALSYRIVYGALGLSLFGTAVCFAIEAHRRHFRWLVVYTTFLALQPGWILLSWENLHGATLYARADCGYGLRSFSLFYLAATIALSVIVWHRLQLTRRSFVFGLAVVFTLINLTNLWLASSGLSRTIPHEIYASMFAALPRDNFVYLIACILLYFLRRLRFPKAKLSE